MIRRTSIAIAITDMLEGLGAWRIWCLLAFADIRGRYRRSVFGQVWITLSMGITVTGIGVVYSAIFQMPVAQYLPLVTVNFVLWGFIAALVNEGAGALVESHMLLKCSSVPRSAFILRAVARSGIVFLHNAILVPIVLVIFGIPPSTVQLLAIPGLAMLLIFAVGLGLALATVCLRFRDVIPMLASAMQLVFFLTPVIWEKSQIEPSRRAIIDWNPFAVFLEIVRDPLLGRLPPPGSWTAALAFLAGACTLGLLVFGRFRSRLAFYA